MFRSLVVAVGCLALFALGPATALGKESEAFGFDVDCGSVETYTYEDSYGTAPTETWSHGRIPGISQGYNGLRRFWFGFVKSPSFDAPHSIVTAARNYFYEDDYGRWERTTVSGPTSVTLRLHLGRRTIVVARKEPTWPSKWDQYDGLREWEFQFSLRRWADAIRRHEWPTGQQRGRKSRFSFKYRFPEANTVSYSAGEYDPELGGPDWHRETGTLSAVECTAKTGRVKIMDHPCAGTANPLCWQRYPDA